MEIDSEIKSLPNNFFYDVRTYEKFFVVMCEIDGQRSLRFFSYDGKPLYNLEYNASATRFDIDMQNNILYLLDYENDTVEFFDISNIIDSVYNLMWIRRTHVIYIDETYKFRQSNPHIPDNELFHTFVVNNEGKVLMVGNPFQNEKMEALFMKIMEKEKKQQEVNKII